MRNIKTFVVLPRVSTMTAFLAAPMAMLMSVSVSAHHVGMLGNDLPHVTGKVEKLHLHAYENCPSNEFDGSNRNVIALLANYTNDKDGVVNQRWNDILLTENSGIPDFTVVDGNACNEDGAMFNLPNGALWDEWNDPYSAVWAVFIRMRGEPNTGMDISLCYTSEVSGGNDIVCDTGAVVGRGSGGKPKVTDVTRKLLGFDTEPYDPANPFWDISTTGRAKATLYFYNCADLAQLPGDIGEGCPHTK